MYHHAQFFFLLTEKKIPECFRKQKLQYLLSEEALAESRRSFRAEAARFVGVFGEKQQVSSGLAFAGVSWAYFGHSSALGGTEPAYSFSFCQRACSGGDRWGVAGSPVLPGDRGEPAPRRQELRERVHWSQVLEDSQGLGLVEGVEGLGSKA